MAVVYIVGSQGASQLVIVLLLLLLLMYHISFFGNKTIEQRSGANLKNMFFTKNLLQIACFF